MRKFFEWLAKQVKPVSGRSNLMSNKQFARFERGYANLWNRARIDGDAQERLRSIVESHILPGKPRYLWAEGETGIPWVFWAVIHYREATNRFDRNMVNGQLLNQVTTIVPKGLGPYASWEDSVRDAVRHMRYDLVPDWTVPRVLYESERTNGFGYMRPGIAENSPYVWAFTNLSDETGKFVRDGVYDANAPEKQAGVAALLLKLIDMDESVRNWAQGKGQTPGTPQPQPPTDTTTADLIARLKAKTGARHIAIVY